MSRSIATTDIDYDTKKYVHKNKKVNYLFPDEYVLDSNRVEDGEVGNSEDTSLAAGLAALVIFCMRIEERALPDNMHQWIANAITEVSNSDRNDNPVRVIDMQLKHSTPHPHWHSDRFIYSSF